MSTSRNPASTCDQFAGREESRGITGQARDEQVDQFGNRRDQHHGKQDNKDGIDYTFKFVDVFQHYVSPGGIRSGCAGSYNLTTSPMTMTAGGFTPACTATSPMVDKDPVVTRRSFLSPRSIMATGVRHLFRLPGGPGQLFPGLPPPSGRRWCPGSARAVSSRARVRVSPGPRGR